MSNARDNRYGSFTWWVGTLLGGLLTVVSIFVLVSPPIPSGSWFGAFAGLALFGLLFVSQLSKTPWARRTFGEFNPREPGTGRIVLLLVVVALLGVGSGALWNSTVEGVTDVELRARGGYEFVVPAWAFVMACVLVATLLLLLVLVSMRAHRMAEWQRVRALDHDDDTDDGGIHG